MNRQSKISLSWLDDKGNPLSLSLLKKQSATWSSEIWEAYLQTLESPTVEAVLPERKISCLSDKSQCELMFRKMHRVEPEITIRDKSHLIKAVNDLSPVEKTIIKKLFWQKLSERQVAKTLNLSRASVRAHYKRALGKLRTKLSPKKHIVEGPNSKTICPSQSKALPKTKVKPFLNGFVREKV